MNPILDIGLLAGSPVLDEGTYPPGWGTWSAIPPIAAPPWVPVVVSGGLWTPVAEQTTEWLEAA